MEYTFAQQSAAFFHSLILGVVLWCVYQGVILLRLYFYEKKSLVAFLDIVFFLTACIFTFLLALAYLNGSVRFYMILGELLSFFALHITVGRPLRGIYKPLVFQLRRFFRFTLKLLKKIIKKLLKTLYKVVYNTSEKAGKFVIFFKKLKNKKSV